MRPTRAVLLAMLVVCAALLLYQAHGKPSMIVSDIRDTITDLRTR